MSQYSIKRQTRRGITLIEVAVTSTICALIASLGIGLIYNLFTFSSAAQSRADQQRTIARFAETFRADARQAVSAESEKVKDAEAVISFKQGGDRMVRYTLNQGEIIREILEGEKRVASDSFLLEPDTAVYASLENASLGVAHEKMLAILTIHEISTKKNQKDLPPIVAAVGICPTEIEISLPEEKKEKEAEAGEVSSEEKEETAAAETKEEEEAVE